MVPSTATFAESLVFSLGRRANRVDKRGSDVNITPYWGHELVRMLVAWLPRSTTEGMMIKNMTEMKEKLEIKYKRRT